MARQQVHEEKDDELHQNATHSQEAQRRKEEDRDRTRKSPQHTQAAEND